MAPGNPGSDRQRILDSYRLYLARERGLADGTITNYLQCAGVFLEHLADPLDVTLRDLSAGQVLGFFQRLRAGSGPPPKSMAGPLRSLLRYLLASGHLSRGLAEAVPPVARWRLASLPVRMDAASVAALLAVFDRSTELGSRNYAIVLLLARLGLRAGEAAGLALEDVNWRAGTIAISAVTSCRWSGTSARRSQVTWGHARRGMPARRCSRLPARRVMP